MNLMMVMLAVVQPLWPEGKMPDFQEHQIAAMTDVSRRADFVAAAHRMPYLDWCDAPSAKARNGGCMILISGGGYKSCCDVRLVETWNKKLTALGFQCVKLVYRTPRPKSLPVHQSAWEDGQRAVRLVRRAARARGFDPEKIGAIGFSAGAHLAAISATSSQDVLYDRVDAADDLSAHLNFSIPVYPAYVLDDGTDGPNARRGDGAAILPEFKFDAKTPPMFMLHGDKDNYSPMASVQLYTELHKRKVPAQLFVYANVAHGLGDKANVKGWQQRVVDWIVSIGF